MRPARLLPALAPILIVILTTSTAAAQMLPPLPGKPSSVRVGVEAASVKQRPSWFLPLTQKPDGQKPDERKKQILDFWGRDDSLVGADSVQFLYGFGGEQRKALSADLMALIFPGGFRLGLGSSVASNGGDSDSKQTPEEAIQRLRDGGDMYVTLAYPLIDKRTDAFSVHAFFDPRLNLLFNGFAGTETVTEATEKSGNIGASAYFELRDLNNAGAIFMTARGGLQMVSKQFMTSASLDSQNFGVFEVAIGAQFGDFLRLSAQWFKAPPGAAGVSLEQLQGWHFVAQLAPRPKK